MLAFSQINHSDHHNVLKCIVCTRALKKCYPMICLDSYLLRCPLRGRPTLDSGEWEQTGDYPSKAVMESNHTCPTCYEK